jgi:hypothetical protein
MLWHQKKKFLKTSCQSQNKEKILFIFVEIVENWSLNLWKFCFLSQLLGSYYYKYTTQLMVYFAQLFLNSTIEILENSIWNCSTLFFK